MSDSLEDRWNRLWQKLNIETAPRAAFDQLTHAYASTGRFYHNLTHIADCLSVFARTKFLAVHPEEVELAIWFHDAVYDTRRDDNEQKSAEWAGRVIRQSGLNSEIAARVARLILATRHTEEVQDIDTQLIVDVDLSILGAGKEAFWQYEENIRKEYVWVPERLFRQKRMNILNGFLSRPYLYYHKAYREMLEKKARANLHQAIKKLSDRKETV